MAMVPGKASLPVTFRSGFRPKVGDSLLGFPEGRESVLNELLETPPDEFGRLDLAVLNLLCASSLPGSENLDIPKCLSRLNRLTAFVKASTERNLHRLSTEQETGRSEANWRMGMLVTNVKRDFGASYSPSVRDDLLAGVEAPFSDSRESFIHGLLDDDPNRRWGTCASIPVLITAVARRLGYPVRLAVTRTHLYARWEGAECFNIEASNPAGMSVLPDDHYRGHGGGMTGEEEKSGFYLRALQPAEEFAVCLKARVACLRDAARYEETLLWSARALQFAPDDTYFAKGAHYVLDIALKHRLRIKHPERKIPPPEDPNPIFFNAGELLAPHELSLCMTIVAHFKESQGNLTEAREEYENACRHNFHGENEQRDLQRFLLKHRLPRRANPLLSPQGPIRFRRIRLTGKPSDEAAMLRQLASECERKGELLKARDALHDLYMFDPGDAEVFQRARAIEQRPQFHVQLKAVVKERRRVLQASGEHRR